MPRLSQRLSGAQPDGPYEGMPAHLLAGVLYWLEGICGYRSGPMDGTRLLRLAAHMGLVVNSGNRPPQVMSQLESAASSDQTFAVDLIDGALEIWGGRNYSEINNLLVSSASVFRVNEANTGLVRVVSDEAQMTYNVATSVADKATTELKHAWTHAFGRNGDPSDAWDHAIKVMEALFIPLVIPKKDKANLGGVIGELRNQGHVWKFVLPGKDDDNDVGPLVGMLAGIWPNIDRHQGNATNRPPTEQEARGVVTLAATIVQWHRDGWVIKRR